MDRWRCWWCGANLPLFSPPFRSNPSVSVPSLADAMCPPSNYLPVCACRPSSLTSISLPQRFGKISHPHKLRNPPWCAHHSGPGSHFPASPSPHRTVALRGSPYETTPLRNNPCVGIIVPSGFRLWSEAPLMVVPPCFAPCGHVMRGSPCHSVETEFMCGVRHTLSPRPGNM